MTKVASLARTLKMSHDLCMSDNERFCPSEPADESNMFMGGGLTGVNVGLENVGVSFSPNAGHVASKRTNEISGANDDRRNTVVPRHFAASGLPRTKILQKVVDFGFVGKTFCSQQLNVWDIFKN